MTDNIENDNVVSMNAFLEKHGEVPRIESRQWTANIIRTILMSGGATKDSCEQIINNIREEVLDSFMLNIALGVSAIVGGETRFNVFVIGLPGDEGIAMVNQDEDNTFSVWIEQPVNPNNGYKPAWGFPTFEAAVRNIMDVVWPACLPFNQEGK